MTILDHITVIDFTRLYPGPLATNLLAQMGAEVIKIEHPAKADLARLQPPFVDGESTLFTALNFAKTIRTIDQESEAGRAELMEMIRNADIVIEQFRPGVMAGWGLGYDDLRALNPGLVYVSLSGYGQDGPYRDQAGHDINYLAYSGILSLTRDADGCPVIPGVQVADAAAGSYMAVTATLAALFRRERTGRGAYVDVSMLDGLLPLLTVPASQLWGGLDPYQANFLSGMLVNYNVYQCADGKWIALGALELKFWNNFCELAGKPEWKRSNPLELTVHTFPKSELENLFGSQPQAYWVALAAGRDVCLTPVQTVAEMEEDPHIRHRGGIVEREKGRKGFGMPFKIAENH